MKVSFFETWVTFIPEDKDPLPAFAEEKLPLTIPIIKAMKLAGAVICQEGITVPAPIATALGGGCDTIIYPLVAGEVMHETIITDRARFIYNSYFTQKELGI